MVGARTLEGVGPPPQFLVRRRLRPRSPPPRPRAVARSVAAALSVSGRFSRSASKSLDLVQHVSANQRRTALRLASGAVRGPRPAGRAACRAARQRCGAAARCVSISSSKPLRSTSRWPTRLPLSTVETYSGRQRLERTRVVPVVEVAAVTLHPGQRAERLAACGRAAGRRCNSRSRRRPGPPGAPCRCWSGWCARRRPGPVAPGYCRAGASSLPR